MKSKVFNILKYIADIILPAIATLYLTLAGLWGLPFGEAISGSIMAIDTFLGVALNISGSKTLRNEKSENIESKEDKNGS